MSTIIGTKQGLANLATQPAANGTINGVRVAAVALCVAGKPPTYVSDDEKRIAKYVQRVGQKLERQGWLPDLRRKRMLDCIVREAVLCEAPGAAETIAQTATVGSGEARDEKTGSGVGSPQNEV